jgi:glutamate synthase domain-containing protein 3
LENWLTMIPKFVKVFPHEFKRVLTQEARKPVAVQAAASAQAVLHG